MDPKDFEISQVWSVPHQNVYGKITGIMRGMNCLMTFPCQNELRSTSHDLTTTRKGDGESQTPPSSGSPVQMCSVQRRSWLFGRFQRKLINESLDTFLSLQKAAAPPSGGGATLEKDLRPVLLKKSKEYRSIIQACVSEMSRYLDDLANGKPVPFKEDPEPLRADCQLLYKMELVLSIAEIVFISTQPGSVIVPQLLTWVRLHFPQCRQRLSEALTVDQPHMYPHYWETVYGLVLQGMVDEARDLLSRHPNSNMDSFLSLEELLRKMPLYKVYSGVSEAEFMARWHHWQSECQSRSQKGDFATCKQLQLICNILCGDMETLVSLCDVVETWYALMTSMVLYSNPVAKLHRLPAAAREAMLAFGSDDDDDTPGNPLDRLLLAAIEANDRLMMKESHSVLGNLWFSAHLCDLLYHAAVAANEDDKRCLREMREGLLVDYGCELASHTSLWQLGLVYVDSTGARTAFPLAEAILERLPLHSHHKATKVVQAAADRSLDHVAMGVCRVMGRHKLREGQLGSAIWWAVRSQDAAFTSHLAHKILHKYVEEGRFESSSLLDRLGPAMFLSDALTFLSKYREFHVLYQEGKMEEAAALLVALIASRLAPEYFWPVLLEDALPLLQSPRPVISADQTYKLMYCLHNVTISAGDSEAMQEKKRHLHASFLEKESEVRRALTDNLARAIIYEGTACHSL